MFINIFVRGATNEAFISLSGVFSLLFISTKEVNIILRNGGKKKREADFFLYFLPTLMFRKEKPFYFDFIPASTSINLYSWREQCLEKFFFRIKSTNQRYILSVTGTRSQYFAYKGPINITPMQTFPTYTIFPKKPKNHAQRHCEKMNKGCSLE